MILRAVRDSIQPGSNIFECHFMLTRRRFLKFSTLAGFTGMACTAAAVETMANPTVTRYEVAAKQWPPGLELDVAVLADLHACEPWMTVERIDGIVEATNALQPDLVVLLGDFVLAHEKITGRVPDELWARALSRLRAPCGVYAVLGNHDWWNDPRAQSLPLALPAAARALEAVSIPVLHNQAVRRHHAGHLFTVAGLGDQLALRGRAGPAQWTSRGLDDLPATLEAAAGGGPVILLAHEPDVFPRVPPEVAVTLCGHTHGGQVRLGGFAPIVPSRYGDKYIYGHVIEDGRHLVVSAGLGCSWWPIRFGAPPEIVIVRLRTAADIA